MDYLPMFAKLTVARCCWWEGRSGPAQGAPAAGGRCQADPGLPKLEPDFHQFADRFTHLAERFTPPT